MRCNLAINNETNNEQLKLGKRLIWEKRNYNLLYTTKNLAMEKKELAVEIMYWRGSAYQVTYLYKFYKASYMSRKDIVSFLPVTETELKTIAAALELEKLENKNGIQYVSRQYRKAEEYRAKYINRGEAHAKALFDEVLSE
jgi:hypothetical protein